MTQFSKSNLHNPALTILYCACVLVKQSIRSRRSDLWISDDDEDDFQNANNPPVDICLDCKFPCTAVQYDGGGSFNKDVKIYTKQGCHLWLIISGIQRECEGPVKVKSLLKDFILLHPPALWIFHPLRVVDNDHLIFLLYAPHSL